MCTLALSLQPGADWGAVIGANRDEFRGRAWDMPAAWWPEDYPGVLGGRDREAGGTWLAVDPQRRRAAAVLNRIEPSPVDDAHARTRGVLPLLAVTGGDDAVAAEDPGRFRPFNLVTVEADRATWWRWDGRDLTRHPVEPGVHLLTSADLDDPTHVRQECWLPVFRGAPRPDPADGWGGWPALLADVETPEGDPAALNVRRIAQAPDYGTVSSSLVALGAGGVRFASTDGPPDRGGWTTVA